MLAGSRGAMRRNSKVFTDLIAYPGRNAASGGNNLWILPPDVEPSVDRKGERATNTEGADTPKLR